MVHSTAHTGAAAGCAIVRGQGVQGGPGGSWGDTGCPKRSPVAASPTPLPLWSPKGRVKVTIKVSLFSFCELLLSRFELFASHLE